jgi:hypothetical protein
MREKLILRSVIALMSLFFVFPVAGMAAQDIGYSITSELWAKAVLQTESKAVTLVWEEVGTDTTPSGATVVSGYFYADPNDFAYGSEYNPEIFVKVYIDANGWCNMAFNHVTVDNVAIYSAHNYAGSAQKSGTATLSSRLVEHQYTGVGTQTGSNFDGTWKGRALITTAKDSYGDPCLPADVTMIVQNNQITGTALAADGSLYNLSGNVGSNGVVTAGIAVGGETVVNYTGTVSGTTGSGTWNEVYGCRGTWSVTKQ